MLYLDPLSYYRCRDNLIKVSQTDFGQSSKTEKQQIDVCELLKKVMKLEEKAERSERIIKQLDERAGAVMVESHSSDSDSSRMSLPSVRHEVRQRDTLFAKNHEYTTNVSQ